MRLFGTTGAIILLMKLLGAKICTIQEYVAHVLLLIFDLNMSQAFKYPAS
jgi:hypothetical protein